MHTNDSFSSIADDCFVKAKELAASDQEREAMEFLFASIALSDGKNLEAREMLAKVFFNNAQYAQVIEQCDLIDPDKRNFTLNELRRKAQRELFDSKYKREKPVRKSKAPGIVLSALVVLAVAAASAVLGGSLFKKPEPAPIPIEQVANTYYQNIIQYPGLEQMLVTVNSNNLIAVSGEVPSQTHKLLLAESGRQWENIAEFNLDQVVITKEPKETEEPQEPNLLPYSIKPGDTLSKIAQTYYKDPDRWVEILKANQEIIKNPRSIPVGLKINIPIMISEKETSGQQN